MTDTNSPTDPATDAGAPAEETTTAPLLDETRDVSRYLRLAGLAVLGLFAVIAVFQFYTSATAAINTWISSEYRPVFRAAFNLAVLLAALAGIGVLLEQLRTDA